MFEKLQNLTGEQRQEQGARATDMEALEFAKRTGVELTAEEADGIAARLPDEALESAAGGAYVVAVKGEKKIF
jgi:hypothetical protein